LTFIINSSSAGQNKLWIDSLSKYSYLLLQMKNGVSYPVYASTGFLVQFQDKLFIVTAWHVLTGRDIYHNRNQEPSFDYLLLRYTDTSNAVRYARINKVVGAIANSDIRPEFQTSPDMFPRGINKSIFEVQPKLNSIEHILFDTVQIKIKKNQHIDTTVLGYGFSNLNAAVSLTEPKYWWRIIDTITPSPYKGKFLYSTPIEDRIDSIYYPNKFYFMSSPIGVPGASGSPIFFKYTLYNKKGRQIKEWVTFAGSQSGKNGKYSFAYMVKGDYLRNRINPPPRKK